MPPIDGTKIMPTGANNAMLCASWPAPEGIARADSPSPAAALATVAALVAASTTLGTLPASAWGATLATPPLFPNVADSFVCQLANVGTKDKDARIEILRTLDQTVVADSGTTTVLAGGQLNVQAPNGTTQYVCRFTVQGKGNFRGSATIFNGSGSDFVAVPAL